MKKTFKHADEFPAIVRWGKLLASFDYYIAAQLEQAKEENAPANAIYKSHDGIWRTTDDITNADTREKLGLPKKEEETK